MTMALVNGRVLDGDVLSTGQAVLLDGSRISAVVPESDIPVPVDERLDLDGHILAPGLIDLQVNGGGGVMFNDAPTPETLRIMGAAHRRYGTTGFLPTLISTDFDTMRRAMEAVRQAIAESVPGVLGIHLEGPFLNPERCGIHHAERFRQVDEAAFELLTRPTGGSTLATIAPECVPADTIARLAQRGVIVFAGHSAATYQQARDGLSAGVRGFTHLFNAMSPLQSRAPGMVGAALEDRDSWCGMIADGRHIHPAVFAIAVAAKRKGYSLLVTDAMATVGSDRAEFNFDGMEISVRDGSCRLPSGALAGSSLNMITAVRNAAGFTGLPLEEALRMASSYPAQALGLQHELGHIRAGYRASFIEIDGDLNIYRSWIDGEVAKH